jgi:acyl-CoA synthetase (NDP forming)
MCRQYGIVQVQDLAEFNETLIAFAGSSRIPQGNRLAVATISGGAAALVADECASGGKVELPQVGHEDSERLRASLPEFASVSNPLDVTGGTAVNDPDMIVGALETMAATGGYDMAAYFCPMRTSGGSPAIRRLTEEVMAYGVGSELPTFVVSLNVDGLVGYWREVIERLGATVLQGARPAIRALGWLGGFHERVTAARGRLGTPVPRLQPDIPSRGDEAPSTLPWSETRSLLEERAVSFPRQVVVTSPDEAGAAAGELGYPVVVKALSPSVSHKTEAGAVRVGIGDDVALASAFTSLQEISTAGAWEDTLIVVEELVDAGVELLVSVSRDPTFGPVVVLGAGGVLVELMGDAVRMALPPMTPDAVEDLTGDGPLAALLGGYRGGPAADREGLVRLLAGVAGLAADRPDIRAIELNPVLVERSSGRLVAVDALVELTR